MLLGVPIVLAVPLAYRLNCTLLQNQAHHIDLSAWIFMARRRSVPP